MNNTKSKTNEVVLQLMDAAKESYRNGVVKALNEYYPKEAYGTKYLKYLEGRVLKVNETFEFHDVVNEKGRRAMTSCEALVIFVKNKPKLVEDAVRYSNQFFHQWMTKELKGKDSHLLEEFKNFRYLDTRGKIFKLGEDGSPIYLKNAYQL